MFTIIVAIKLNKKMSNLERQFSTNTLDRSYVSRDNNFNNTMSSFDLLNTLFCLSNNIALQLS